MFSDCTSVLVCWKNLEIIQRNKKVKKCPLNSEKETLNVCGFLLQCTCIMDLDARTTNVSKFCNRSECILQLEICDSTKLAELLYEMQLQLVKMLSSYSNMQFFTANLQFVNSNTLFDNSNRHFVHRNMQCLILKQLFGNSNTLLFSSIQTDNSSIKTRYL